MAQRTISAAGGNWNSTATWVEGAIPTTSDFVVGNASSGSLVVNVIATVQYLDFTLYTNTLTINTNILLGTAGLVNATTTFGASMSYDFIGVGSSQGGIVKGNTIQNYQMLGTTRIPRFGSSGGAQLNLLSDIFVVNCRSSAVVLFSGFTLYVSGDFITSFSAARGSTNLILDGTGVLDNGVLGFQSTTINTLGTITLSGLGLRIGDPLNQRSITFTHIQGTLLGNIQLRMVPTTGVNTITMNLLSGYTWDAVFVLRGNSTIIWNCDSPINFSNFFIGTDSQNTFQNLTISGTNLVINDLQILNRLDTPGGTYTILTLELIITPPQSLTINNTIDLNGGSDLGGGTFPNTVIRSNTPSTQVNLIMNTFNQYVSRTRFTDINCSGGNTLYGQALTLTNTTNIEQYTLPPSGGGGGGASAYTFFS